MGHTSVTCSECGKETDSAPCQHCGENPSGTKETAKVEVYYTPSEEKWTIHTIVPTDRYPEENKDYYDTKDEAVPEAREHADSIAPSILTIYKKGQRQNAPVEAEHSY